MINNAQANPTPKPPALSKEDARKKSEEQTADTLRQTTRTALDTLVHSQDQVEQVLQGADQLHRQIRRAQLPLLSLGKSADPAPALKEAKTQIATLVSLSQQLGQSATLDLLRPLEAAVVTLSNAGYYLDKTDETTKGRAERAAEKTRNASERLNTCRQPLEMDGVRFAESLTDAGHAASQPPSLEQADKVLEALSAADYRLKEAEEHTDPLQMWLYEMRGDGQQLATALDPKAPPPTPRPATYAEELEATLAMAKQMPQAFHQINKSQAAAAEHVQTARKTLETLDQTMTSMNWNGKPEDLPRMRSDAAALVATVRGEMLIAEGLLFGTQRRSPAETLLPLVEQMRGPSARLTRMGSELDKLDGENAVGPFGHKYRRLRDSLEGTQSLDRGLDLAQAVLLDTVRWPRDFTEIKRALDDCHEVFQLPDPETHLRSLHGDMERMRRLIGGLSMELPFGSDQAAMKNALANAASFIEAGLPALEAAAKRARKEGI